jgi:very-short-patch-repair endonuclease
VWRYLRNRGFEGLKFRRQVPFGPYIADFFSEELRLVVELDGGQHAESERDAVRTRYLESQGLRVLRFWNNDVLGNVEGVLESLKRFIANHPSPSGEGGARARQRAGG